MATSFSTKNLKKSIILVAILLLTCFSISSSSEQVFPVPVTLIINPADAGSITTTRPGAESPQEYTSQTTLDIYVNYSFPLTATPNSGYIFSHWSSTSSIVLNSPNSASTTVMVYGNGTITATFTPQYEVTFATSGGGDSTTSPSGTQTCTAGQVVPIIANPASSFVFSTWQADPPNAVTFANPSSTSTTATITGSATITAEFTEGPTDTPIPTPTITTEPTVTPTEGPSTNTPDTSTELSPTPNHSTQTIDVIQISAIVIAMAVVASLATGFYLSYLLRPSLKKLGRDLQNRHAKEAKQEEEEEKNKERDRWKRKPFLKLEVKAPPLVWGSKSATAEGKLRNQGVASAQDIQVSAVATPGLVLVKSAEKISTLRPFEEKALTFPFSANDRIRRGNYTLRFEVKSKQTASRVKDRSIRAMKIGLLYDVEGKRSLVSLKKWLSDRSVSWSELTSADNFIKLLEFDLLVVAYALEMPLKWIKNISNFVDQSQSLLVISGINVSNSELLSKTLGYKNMSFEDFGPTGRSLIVLDNNHEATKTMPLGKEIPLSGWGRTCTSNVDKGLMLAKITIRTEDEVNPTKDFPAIVANNYGDGRTIYLNFCPEQPSPHECEIFENIFNWLLFKNTTCALGEEKLE
jgi:hypothetical protein